jgi:hypothetical protein
MPNLVGSNPDERSAHRTKLDYLLVHLFCFVFIELLDEVRRGKNPGISKKKEREKPRSGHDARPKLILKAGPISCNRIDTRFAFSLDSPQATLAAGCTIFPRVGEWRRAAYTPCAIASVAVEGEKSERT